MSMAKEYRTADELSGMIMSALAVKDVAVQVRKARLRLAADRRCISRGSDRLSKTSRRNRQSTPPSILSSRMRSCGI
jgi:hypothetical protein